MHVPLNGVVRGVPGILPVMTKQLLQYCERRGLLWVEGIGVNTPTQSVDHRNTETYRKHQTVLSKRKLNIHLTPDVIHK